MWGGGVGGFASAVNQAVEPPGGFGESENWLVSEVNKKTSKGLVHCWIHGTSPTDANFPPLFPLGPPLNFSPRAGSLVDHLGLELSETWRPASSLSWPADPGRFPHPVRVSVAEGWRWRRSVCTLYLIGPLTGETTRDERWRSSIWILFLCFSPPGPAPPQAAVMCDLRTPAHRLAEARFSPSPSARLSQPQCQAQQREAWAAAVEH